MLTAQGLTSSAGARKLSGSRDMLLCSVLSAAPKPRSEPCSRNAPVAREAREATGQERMCCLESSATGSQAARALMPCDTREGAVTYPVEHSQLALAHKTSGGYVLVAGHTICNHADCTCRGWPRTVSVSGIHKAISCSAGAVVHAQLRHLRSLFLLGFLLLLEASHLLLLALALRLGLCQLPLQSLHLVHKAIQCCQAEPCMPQGSWMPDLLRDGVDHDEDDEG